ncbi:MAG: molybdopterin converting factor subunit 1 [Burkholderiales bacterium]|jgi:molybdopterin synthase sulfur carrier subunit|nr:molybdopterin converting factor subunit 1 [Burkholderiales bacterium]
MNIKVVYLARLREALGCSEEVLSLASDAPTLGDVFAVLRERGEPWSYELGEGRAVRVAINHEVVATDAVVHSGDEIAFFPPVTGG